MGCTDAKTSGKPRKTYAFAIGCPKVREELINPQVLVESSQTTLSPDPEKPLREQVIDLIARKGYSRREEPFQLSSGELSHDYIDCRYAVEHGADLRLVAEAVIELTESLGIPFDAVGGLTLGADSTAHAVALIAGKRWFSVRKEAKRHGKQKMIEGAVLTSEDRILLVEDVATTGDSTMKAVFALEEIGASIVLTVPIVDRGELTRS
ncbi:MAG: hypothetical protein ACRD1R_08110, partial [Acidobacteriota bacterium]